MSGPQLSIQSRNAASASNTTYTAANQGMCLLTQVVELIQSSTATVTVTAFVPKHSQIVDFLVDTTVTWNSATSATLTIGTAAADTAYLGGITSLTTVTAGSGRVYPTTFTQAQLTSMLDVGSTESVAFSVTPVGATSAGTTFVTMRYIQTQNYQNA
jgi:hypothetical protein